MKTTGMKWGSALMALTMILGMAACSKKPAPTEPQKETNPETTQVSANNTEPSETSAATAPVQETTAAPTEPQQDESIVKLRQEMEPSACVAAIFFLGCYEGDPAEENFIPFLEKQGYLEEYAFLEDIPQERMARNDGYEVYCIVPFDPQASVRVTQWDETDSAGVEGSVLYEAQDGAPFLIQGNVSDIMPNLSVSIKDHFASNLVNYHPHISLEDGRVALPGDSEPLILDMSLNQPVNDNTAD